MRFNRKKFFDAYREQFGKLEYQQVRGLERLLEGIENDPHIKHIEWAAYMLATSKHETAHTFQPIHEYGGKAYFIKRYGGHTRKGKELGNDTPDEGYFYAGKGDVQTTGEANYEKAEVALRREYPKLVADFEKRTGKKFDLTVGDQKDDELDPMNALDPAISYAIMSFGMRNGMFTGRKMSDFQLDPPNYIKWRPIINGTDKAQTIAGIARKFETILRESAASPTDELINERPAQTESEKAETAIDLPDTAAQPTNGQQEVKIEVGADGGTKIETSNTTSSPKERIAVVRKPPEQWFSRVWAKVTGAVSGNVVFQWIWAQLEKIQGLSVPEAVWIIVSVSIALGSLLWIIHEIIATWRANNYQEAIDNLLVKENSTANNLVQLIPHDEIELYRAKGFKIITRGDSVPAT
jgi:putative chitinase